MSQSSLKAQPLETVSWWLNFSVWVLEEHTLNCSSPESATHENWQQEMLTHTSCQDGKHRDYWVKREKTVSEPCVAPKGCWFRWPEINGTSDCGKWPGDDKYWIGIWLRISSLLKLLPMWITQLTGFCCLGKCMRLDSDEASQWCLQSLLFLNERGTYEYAETWLPLHSTEEITQMDSTYHMTFKSRYPDSPT